MCLLTDNQDDLSVRVLLNLLPDGIDIRLILLDSTIANQVLSVTSQRGTIPIRQIVDDEDTRSWGIRSGIVLALDILEELAHLGDFGCCVTVTVSISHWFGSIVRKGNHTASGTRGHWLQRWPSQPVSQSWMEWRGFPPRTCNKGSHRGHIPRRDFRLLLP